jgi:hypothetical protein
VGNRVKKIKAAHRGGCCFTVGTRTLVLLVKMLSRVEEGFPSDEKMERTIFSRSG